MTAQQFNEQFQRLNASTYENAYSGLTAEDTDQGVKIFDDYTSGVLLDPENAIASLETLEPIDWSEHDNTDQAFDPIWTALNMSSGFAD